MRPYGTDPDIGNQGSGVKLVELLRLCTGSYPGGNEF